MLTILLAIAAAASSHSANLDAPLPVYKPTLRSEMQRGQDAAFDCQMRVNNIDPTDGHLLVACVDSAQNENRQKMGQGFEAFNAGLWYWTRDNLKLVVDHFPTPLNNSSLVVADAGLRDAERTLHLTDADVDRAITRK